jgi:dienelactone hydrolase
MVRIVKFALLGLAGVVLIGVLAIVAFFAATRPAPMSLEALNAQLQPGYQLFRPEGDGPFPVAVLHHGCGGLIGEQGDKDVLIPYAEAAVSAGYIAIIVDSFRPRGIGFDEARATVCSGLQLRGRARAGDVAASLAYARSLPDAAPNGFVIAGWSHGGWAVMEAMIMDMRTDWPPSLTSPPGDALPPLAGVYLTYPYCGFPSRAPRRGWASAVPTDVVMAEYDSVSDVGRCHRAFDRMRESGVELEVELFEGVTHAFDESDQTATSVFVYDADAAAAAHARFGAFLEGLRASDETD